MVACPVLPGNDSCPDSFFLRVGRYPVDPKGPGRATFHRVDRPAVQVRVFAVRDEPSVRQRHH
eukprot:15451912-Heterocapsa_arctica.AAC.1